MVTAKLKIWSPPARGAWIEMPPVSRMFCQKVSPPARGAWIEIDEVEGEEYYGYESPPARGAWIEIISTRAEYLTLIVAPRTGGVD